MREIKNNQIIALNSNPLGMNSIICVDGLIHSSKYLFVKWKGGGGIYGDDLLHRTKEAAQVFVAVQENGNKKFFWLDLNNF